MRSLDLPGTPKNVLITGASGSLGSVVVDRFLKAGCRVVAAATPGHADLSSRDGLTWLGVDLSNPDSVRSELQKIHEPLDGLIHCAGGFRFSHADEISDEDVEFLIGSNLKSAIYLIREVLPQMKKTGFGRIVLVSAKPSLAPGSGISTYAASKAGLNAIVASVAEEVRQLDININAVLPSIIDTPANREAMPKAKFETWVRREELAEIIFSLTSPLARPINGALIPVTGRV